MLFRAFWSTFFVLVLGSLNAFAQDPESISILSWNIQHGETNDYLGGHVLQERLINAIHKYDAPEVILLHEFNPDVLGKETMAEIQKSYSLFYQPYNSTALIGIGALIAHGLEYTHRMGRELDFTPLDMAKRAREAYRAEWNAKDSYQARHYLRTYMRFSINTKRGPVHVIPVHTIQPWDLMEDELQEKLQRKYKFGKIPSTLLSKAMIGSSVVISKNNPLYHQLIYWLNAVEDDVAQHFAGAQEIRHHTAVMMGDWNFFSHLTSKIETAPYKLLKSRGFTGALPHDIKTFPTPEAPTSSTYPPIQIDQAYITPCTVALEARAMKWQGSDHYPIRVKVRSR